MDNKPGRQTASRTIRLTDEVTVAPFLMHAIAATLGVVVLPITLVVSALYVFDPPPSVFATALFAIASAVVATVIGSQLWQRVEESDAIEFGELMLWAWDRRNRAENLVKDHTAELGLDVQGRPTKVLPRARRLELLKELTAALQEKDSYTKGHSRRVERLTYSTAVAMGLTGRDLKVAQAAASVHDVGKVYVPDEILRKPGALTDLEFDTMKNHAAQGARMVESVGDKNVTAAVRHHHERWDGRGYPDGLVAREIPLAARIISVADTFDALTSTRTYRAKKSRRTALEIIEAERGKQFDPEVVPYFVSAMRTRTGAYISAVFAFLPLDALAGISSWGKKRGSALAAAAIALVAAIASGTVLTDDPSTAITVAAPAGGSDAAGSAPGGSAGTRAGGGDGRGQDAPTAVDNPPADEDVVLGTRIEEPAPDEPVVRDGGDAPRVDKRPARPAPSKDPDPSPPPPADEASWPPGHGSRATDGPPGRDRPGARGAGDNDPSPTHGRDCEGNPGRGDGRGRQHHC